MKWIIECQNGIVFKEGLTPFETTNFKRIYFENKGHGYGFTQDGKFFVDKTIYDFKIDISRGTITPFQNKTGLLEFGVQHYDNRIFSWNVGYELCNEKYFLSILSDGGVTFTAEKDGRKRNVRLQ